MEHEFKRLDSNQQENRYYATSKVKFDERAPRISPDYLEKSFQFAYQMTFGKGGEHRDHRSGGSQKRPLEQIFADAFQGKLSEFVLAQTLRKYGLKVSVPDTSVSALGEWDSYDLALEGRKISVKSTKYYGNMLFLEAKDWDENGIYLPNETTFDYTFLVRIKGAKDLSKLKGDKDKLHDAIFAQQWFFDVPGFITNADLSYIIREGEKYLIRKGDYFNRTRMDADNYYVQAGSMRRLKELPSLLRN